MAAATPAPIVAQRGQAKVLVLYGEGPSTPTANAANAVVRERLVKPFGGRVAVYEEFPDFAWLADPSNALRAAGPAALDAFRHYIALKYSGTSFAAVLIVGAPAFDFYRSAGGPLLFPHTPVVACLVARDRIENVASDTSVSIVTDAVDLHGTLRLALALQPDTRTVVVIGGTSSGDRAYLARARAEQPNFEPLVSFRFVVGRSLQQLSDTVARIGPHAIILFLSVTADSAGDQYMSSDVAERLASVASAPAYTWTTSAFGRGVVGGRLLRVDSAVTHAVGLVARLIEGESPASLPRRVADATVATVDWRALRRWKIDERRVPAGASIVFHDLSVWERYRGVIVLTLALMLVEAAVIATLMVQRARRQRAEARNRRLLDDLQTSHERVHQLAGRLITTQEAERTRIGRELHDDVNQKIAALAIGLSRLRHRVPADSTELVHDVSRLQERAAALAVDVRQISHQLHSSVLQHAGVVAAIRAACTECAEQNEIEATLSVTGDADDLPADIALCVYRVAQEALRNVGRHARAHHVRVSIICSDEGIRLSIADDGCGFDARAVRATAGLGFVSLDERARLVNGTLDVASHVGQGTTLTLWIPRPAADLIPHLEHHGSHDRIAR